MIRRLRDDTTARLRRHRELGHAVLLASASLEAVPRPARCDCSGSTGSSARGSSATRADASRDGSSAANCRGPEKARRVREWLAEAGLEDAELWAYGDSPGDAELLAPPIIRFASTGLIAGARPWVGCGRRVGRLTALAARAGADQRPRRRRARPRVGPARDDAARAARRPAETLATVQPTRPRALRPRRDRRAARSGPRPRSRSSTPSRTTPASSQSRDETGRRRAASPPTLRGGDDEALVRGRGGLGGGPRQRRLRGLPARGSTARSS